MKLAPYSMTYFHLSDLHPVYDGVMTKEDYESYFGETGTTKARYMRYMKSNLGVGRNKKKLFRLFDTTSFSNVEQANSCIDWSKSPVITL